jgi:hypothetical protein
MQRSARTLTIAISIAIGIPLCACNFFNSPVTDIDLPTYPPYLTLISFLEANSDTTFILVSQSQQSNAKMKADENLITLGPVNCVIGANVMLTDLTTGQSSLAYNDYTPGSSSYIGLYMVKRSELPIVDGHNYTIRASYNNFQPVTAQCALASFSNASFDYKIQGSDVLVTIKDVDTRERYFFVYLKLNNRESRNQIVNSERMSNGSVSVAFRDDDRFFFSGHGFDPTTSVDTCFVYELNKDAFTYFQKVETYTNAQNGLQSQPTYLFSNIDNGQGIFAARRVVPRKR